MLTWAGLKHRATDNLPFAAPTGNPAGQGTVEETKASPTVATALNVYLIVCVVVGATIIIGATGGLIWGIFFKKKSAKGHKQDDLENPKRGKLSRPPPFDSRYTNPTPAASRSRSPPREKKSVAGCREPKRVSWASTTSTLNPDGSTDAAPMRSGPSTLTRRLSSLPSSPDESITPPSPVATFAGNDTPRFLEGVDDHTMVPTAGHAQSTMRP